MSTRSFTIRALFCCLAMLIGVSLFAQAPTGTILGTVTDQNGGTLAGTTVTARNTETGQIRSVTTSDDGGYRIPALPVGAYEVEFTHDGFKKSTHAGLTLTVAQQAVVDMAMELGAVGQSILVTGEAPIVNTTSGSLGGLVNQEKIADLPLNGRNYVDLSLMQLGVTQHKNIGTTAGMGGVWYSSSGAPLRSNSYLLDGANMVSLYGGTAGSIAGTSLGVEGIREYKVVTNNFTAEYGMTMGSQMLIVSKGGSNEFHGTAFEYLRNSSLDARNFFDSTAFLPATAPGGGERLPPFRQNQFGGSFGGPIRKDKTFFFATYEALHSNAGQTIKVSDFPLNCFGANGKILLTANPCATLSGGNVDPRVQALSQLYSAPNLPNPSNASAPFNQLTFPFDQKTRENYGQMRVDENFSGVDSFFARYTADDTNLIKNGNYPANQNIWVSRAQFITLAENHVYSPQLLNTARFSFSRTHLRTDAAIVGTGPGLSLVPGFDLGNVSVTGVQTLGPDNFNPFSPTQNIFTWSDDVYYTKGSHSFKFGFLVNHYQQEVYEPNASMKGSVSFQGVPQFFAAQYNTYNATTSNSQESVHTQNNTYGIYAQDDYRVTRRFTLNLGIRYEFSTVPREIYGVEGALVNLYTDTAVTIGPYFKNPSLKNFSPRIGFAWDIFGDGKTSLHGGFQEAYDVGAIGSVLVDQASRQKPFVNKITVTTATPATPLIPLTIPLTLSGNPNIGNANVSNTTGEIDYNLRQPHMLQYNLALERQLPFDFVVNVAYAGSRGLDLWQGLEANPRKPTAVINGLPYWTGTEANLNPAFGSIFYQAAAGDSYYNSAQIGVTKRLSKGLQVQSSLTFSRLLDDSQGQLTADGKSGYIPNPFDERSAFGPAAFDTPRNWRFNFQYDFPTMSRGGFVGKMLNGWWTSGIATIQSGYAFSPTLTTNVSKSGQNSGAGNIDLPDLVTSQNLAAAKLLNPNAVVFNADTVITGNINQWFNPNMFTLPSVDLPANAPAGSSTIGTVSTNMFRMPGLATFDYSLVKDTKLGMLGEAGNLEFRAEFFNLFNTANFGKPALGVLTGSGATGGVPISNAGQISTTSTTARQIQFALKLAF